MTETYSSIARCDIAGFWKRLLAFLFDVLFLALLGNLLGLLLAEAFAAMGNWGRMLGFVIALFYFGMMNSTLFKGQTLGKKLLGIAVVNSDGKPLGLVKSVVRYGIIGAPYFLSGILVSHDQMQSWAFFGLILLIIGPLLSVVYLYLFNRRTRQSLHDLVVASYVVSTAAFTQRKQEQENIASIWNLHWMVVAGVFLFAAAVPYSIVQSQFDESQANKIQLISLLRQNPAVRHVEIREGERNVSIAQQTTNVQYISADITLKRNQIEHEMLAQNLATALAQEYRGATPVEMVQVNLLYGFDIGIARRTTEVRYQFTPQALLNPGLEQ